MCRNATDFQHWRWWMSLLLCFINFLFITFFLLAYIGFLHLRSCHGWVYIILPLFSLKCHWFICWSVCLSFLTVMAKTLSAVLHRSGENQYSYQRKHFQTSSLAVMLAVSFTCVCTQLCPTLHNLLHSSPPGSSVH